MGRRHHKLDQDLIRAKRRLARPLEKFRGGHSAPAVRTGNHAGGAQAQHGWGGISGGGGIAKIPADAGAILDLHRPHQSAGIHQNGVELSNERGLGHCAAGHRCAQAQSIFGRTFEDIELGDALDVNHYRGIAAFLFHLRDEFDPTRQHASTAVGACERI